LKRLTVKGTGVKEDAVTLSYVRAWFVHGDCIFMTLNGKKAVLLSRIQLIRMKLHNTFRIQVIIIL
jgi:hypothetical protein